MCNGSTSERNVFPYKYERVENKKSYEKVRLESQIGLANLHLIQGYFKKWFLKCYTATEEQKSYFDMQRRLLATMASEEPQKPIVEKAHLGAVGDLMWIRNQWDSFVTEETLAQLSQYDVLFGNLETMISNSFPVSDSKKPNRYNSDKGLLTSFKGNDNKNLFTAISVAANHTFDFGDQGILDTVDFLDRENIAWSGIVRKDSDDRVWTKFSRNGISFGFYAATTFLNDPKFRTKYTTKVNFTKGFIPLKSPIEKHLDLTEIEAALREMENEKIDFKIVTLHWGFEYELYPEPEYMIAAREIVRLGADMLVGTHPHVPQPAEVCFVNDYKTNYEITPSYHLEAEGRARKALIIYSMGNFTTALWSHLIDIAAVFQIDIVRHEDGTIDWYRPGFNYFKNHFSDSLTAKRALVPLTSYLQSGCYNNGCSEDFVKMASFFREHFLGQSISEQQQKELTSIGLRDYKNNRKNLLEFLLRILGIRR